MDISTGRVRSSFKSGRSGRVMKKLTGSISDPVSIALNVIIYISCTTRSTIAYFKDFIPSSQC